MLEISSSLHYHKRLKERLAKELELAENARKKRLDPADAPEIKITRDLAERVEALIGIDALSTRIRELEDEGLGREEIALQIGIDFADGRFGTYKKIEIIENAVRTGVAILTEGVVAAPIEGIARIESDRNNDGSEYIKIFYSGPIRSAGGTAQALSVLAADYIRKRMGFAAYQPRDEEIRRYILEVSVYDRISGLQYTPRDEEIEMIVRSCPICIDGDATEEIEVSGYKGLERVATDKIRGGMVLVLSEGVAMKAPKIKRHVDRLGLKGWDWLTKLLKPAGDIRKKNFLADLIAGRPVFGHPSAKGSFRLRYGRARNSGLEAVGLNPVTMSLLGFTAAGTQIKLELPGKAGCVVPVETIEGPTVKLKDGSLVRLDAQSLETMQEASQSQDKFWAGIAEIVDLGEILIDYGDFLETGHRLVPGAYTHEWWLKELETAVARAGAESKEEAAKWRLKREPPSQAEAIEIASRYAIPLHPEYTYLWEDITEEAKEYLTEWISKKGTITVDGRGITRTLFISAGDGDDDRVKNILEDLLVPHRTREIIQDADKKKFLVIEEPGALLRPLGLNDDLKRDESVRIKTRSKAPTRIGARMGRPEKSKERRMTPAPHSLFPIGEYGGKNISLKDALKSKVIDVEILALGHDRQSIINNHNNQSKKTNKTGNTSRRRARKKRIDLLTYYQETIKRMGEVSTNSNSNTLDVRCVKSLISKHKVAEHLGKGILRAKHDVVVFKDGTIRYDFTNLPLTHFKPEEVGLSREKALELGYSDENRINELKQQDIIISEDAASYLLKVSQFIDSLLLQFYDLPPYYRASCKEDLIGQLVLGLAPHTSAGILGRIVGFTRASACYAHPFFHAAKRRNCLAPNTEILVTNSAGRLKTMDLESLYNSENACEEVVDDFGTTRKRVEGFKTYALNPEDGRFELKQVKSVIKTPAPAHLVSVSTRSGRSFISSPEHRTMVWSNGKIHHKKILELDAKDKLLIPKKLEIEEEEERAEIDLLKAFLDFDDLSRDVMVRGARKEVEQLMKDLGGLKSTAEQIGIGKKTVSNYVYRDSIPLPILHSLLRWSDRDWDAIPRECQLGLKRDHTAIPRLIKLDERFMRLIGYYLAEGYARSVEKEFYQVSMASQKKERKDDMQKCIKDVFGFLSSGKDEEIVISNRLIYHLFVDILGVGKGAKETRIPLFLRNLPLHKIKELLRAYFSCDGSVERDKLVVSCSSVSEKLLQDIGLQLLRFGIFYRLKRERKAAGGVAKRFYERKGSEDKLPVFDLHYLIIRSRYARKFGEEIGFVDTQKNEALKVAFAKEKAPRISSFGDAVLDEIKKVELAESNFEFLYDIEVVGHHNFLVNNFVLSANCDGDEDSVLLLLDALLNFSLSFLPDKRGGKMDAPLTLIPIVNPKEVDKEAHNVSTACEYPLKFYESACAGKHPKEVESAIEMASSKIEEPKDVYGFGYTHETSDIAAGPLNSLYKELDTMEEKMEAQLRLAKIIRAVDAREVAERVIENHFLRDIKGNLRAFGSQKMRCNRCNTKYRRIPLVGRCKKCGSPVVPTVHAASIKKYLDLSLRIADEYHVSDYTRQRLELLNSDVELLFPVAEEKQKALSDFM